MTKSQEIAKEFIDKGIASHDKRFSELLKKKCLGEKPCVSIVPDIFKICENEFCQSVICYEIEDHHALNDNKISKYAELWFHLDGEYWNLYLFPVYRDGTIGKEINLMGKFYEGLGSNAQGPSPKTVHSLLPEA